MIRLCLLALLVVGCTLKKPDPEPLAVDTRPRAACVQTHADSSFRSVRTEFVVQANGKLDPSSIRIVGDNRQPNQDRIGFAALPNVRRYLKDCSFEPATIAGSPVSYTHSMWVRVADRR